MVRIDSVLNNALTGLQTGISRANDAAGEIARLTTGSQEVRDTVKPLLELHKAEQEVATNAKVIEATDEALGRFVDVSV